MKSNANLEKLNEKVREQKAITLIALVITIIVLLILAGVSIAMLTGENGILTKASTAKENTQKAEVIERAQIDIVAAQAENESGDITETQLKTVLDKYFTGAPEKLPDDLSTVTLTTKSEYGNYLIKVSDIYNGTVSRITWVWTDTDNDGTKNIGDVVRDSTGESFRIISTKDDKYALLAEKNIGVDLNNNPDIYLKQSDSAETIVFSNTNYWSSETSYPVNLNSYTSTSVKSTDAIEYAKAYGTAKGVTGRLITVEEVFTITGLTSTGTISSPDWIKTTHYWLGSARGTNVVWRVSRGGLGSIRYDGYHNGDNLAYGVRSVIEISKSLIQ